MQIVKNENEDIPVLYGVYTDKNQEGDLMGLIIDSLDGAKVIRANGNSEAEVKYCLGFSTGGEYVDSGASQEECDANDELRQQVLAMLGEQFPEGYQLEWVGHWRNDPRTVKLCADLDGKEIPEDGFWDYMLPERAIKTNVDRAAQMGYTVGMDAWKGNKSKDFYLGIAGAARIITSAVMQYKTQKELLEFINRFSFDAVLLADKKSNKSGIIV